jgi:hypothetical protein
MNVMGFGGLVKRRKSEDRPRDKRPKQKAKDERGKTELEVEV